MPMAIPLIAAGAAAYAGVGMIAAGGLTAFAGGMMIAGAGLTAIGTLTHDQELMKWGSVVGLAGGVTSLATSLTSAATAAASEGSTAATTTLSESSVAAPSAAPAATADLPVDAVGADPSSAASAGSSYAAPAAPGALDPAFNTGAASISQNPGIAATGDLPGLGTASGSDTGLIKANMPSVATEARVGAAPAGSDSMFDRLGGKLKDVADWANKNPASANMVGGLIKGAAGAYSDRDMLRQKEAAQNRLIQAEIDRTNASTRGVTVGRYAPPAAAVPYQKGA